MQYGSEKREEPWSMTIPDVFVDVKTTNDLLAAHLFLRLQPADGDRSRAETADVPEAPCATPEHAFQVCLTHRT